MPTKDHVRFVAGLKTALEQKCENRLNDSLAQVMCAAANPNHTPAWARDFNHHFDEAHASGYCRFKSAEKALKAITPRQP